MCLGGTAAHKGYDVEIGRKPAESSKEQRQQLQTPDPPDRAGHPERGEGGGAGARGHQLRGPGCGDGLRGPTDEASDLRS